MIFRTIIDINHQGLNVSQALFDLMPPRYYRFLVLISQLSPLPRQLRLLLD